MGMRFHHRHGLKAIASIALAVFAVGCTVQLAYLNLDRLLIRWVDDKIDLSTEQKTWVRDMLDEKLSWHCGSHLPRYAAMLGQFRDDLNQGKITLSSMLAYRDQITQFGQELLDVATAPATELMASLTDRQVKNLLQSFDDSNQELVSRLSEPDIEKRHMQRADRMERRLARFMGDLNPEQRTAIEQWARDYQSTEAHRLAHAYRWQADFKRALALRHDHPKKFADAMTVLLQPTRGWTAIHRQISDDNQMRTLQLITAILNQATPRQTSQLMRKLEGYANDFDALSCSASPQVAQLN